jgi:predicted dehydrogenase
VTLKDKTGVAIIGLGRVGKTHIDAVQLNPDTARLAAVIDANESLAKSIAEEFNTKPYFSVEAALSDPDIQAIVICLPHNLHKPIALQVMEAGRHVLVEKPWATCLADGKEMLDKAREKGVVLQAGQDLRFLKTMQEAKKRITQGEIGDLFNILFVMTEIFTATPAPSKFTAPTWWQDVKKTGGLTFTMLGSHTVDIILWMYEGKKPVRVYSEAQSINPELEGMDEVLITIRFDDGSMATNYLSINTKPAKNECLIVGTEGRILIDITGGHDLKKLVGIFATELYVHENFVFGGNQKPHNFAVQMREFLQAIMQKREPAVKHSEILTQLAILDAAQKSAESHQPVLL